jgi:hypothetical protein
MRKLRHKTYKIPFYREVMENGDWVELIGEAEGTFDPGHPGNWEEPPENDEVIDITATMGGQDITATLTEKELLQIEEEIIELGRDGMRWGEE